MGHSARAAEAMSAADPAGTSELIARVLADQPDVVAALDEAHQAAWSATDARLLEMCRIRAAQLIGCTAEAEARMPGVEVSAAVLDALPSWPSSSLFDDVDRAVLAWCEMFVIDVASMTDELVAPLRAHLGDAGLVDLTNALLVIEQRQRLRCTWEVLW
jgi:alkylhydroperoxidase family enzyme